MAAEASIQSLAAPMTGAGRGVGRGHHELGDLRPVGDRALSVPSEAGDRVATVPMGAGDRVVGVPVAATDRAVGAQVGVATQRAAAVPSEAVEPIIWRSQSSRHAK